MRFGLAAPNVGDYADVALLEDLATSAEAAGWDGLFLWDHLIYRREPVHAVVEPWTALAVLARATTALRLGVLVTPLARRRPWVLARQIATVAQLAQGRLVVGAGLGTPPEEFSAFGEPDDLRVRAARLDEALEVLVGLLSGDCFSYGGAHHQVEDVAFLPTIEPRPPIWVAGRWPNRAPFRRAARYDGVYAEGVDGRALEPHDVADLAAFCAAQRQASAPSGAVTAPPAPAFDIVVAGATVPGPSAPAAAMAEAGATWWLEYLGPKRGPLKDTLARVAAGPPEPGT